MNQPSTLSRTFKRRGRLALPVAALAATGLLAACGSSGSGSNTGSGGSTASSSGSGNVTVANVAGYGKVLEYKGQAVYVLNNDPSGGSKCAGSCAKTWTPVPGASLSAGSGVTASDLSSFKRTDGTSQALYNKHALYTHGGSPGSVAGTAADGGIWYLIDASGSPVKSTTAGGY